MPLHIVTGAFGYIGRHIAATLLEGGERVRTVTTHPQKPDPFAGRVEAYHYDFDRPERLVEHLQGARTLFNTYWIRFEHGGLTFDRAVDNTRVLFEAAREAGVQRIVHISVTRPRVGDPLPYYDGKARQEEALRECGVSYAIVRPSLLFGRGGLLVNNIAWLLRRFPVFPIFGSGDYRLQPVFIDDLARLSVQVADRQEDLIRDAVGPETLTFESMVRKVAAELGRRVWMPHVPPWLGIALGRLVGFAMRDVLLTRDELRGLMQEKLTSDEAAIDGVRFSDWLGEAKDGLGRDYYSELGRHFRWRPNRTRA